MTTMEEYDSDTCPNGCGELVTTQGQVDSRNGQTYFNVVILYCEDCGYVAYTDATL